jgi:uncharacterized protein YukE
VANYNVDIQVGIKGAQKVTKFRQEINRTAKEVDGLNKQIRRAAGNKFENSIDRLNASVSKTSSILNRAAVGTTSFTKAAELFVKAERERDIVLQKTQKTLENIKRSQLGMQTVEQREHQLLMRGNKLRELRLQKDRQLQKQQKLNRATTNALIGGAFPLLFGQGVGASVGGALGGFGGGLLGGQFGFALSLVGTSLGSAVDRFVDGARKVGEAMNENAKEFDRVQNIIGKEGADKLSAFASSTKTLSKTFGDFILGAQSGIAGLIGATGILNNLISGMQMRIAKGQAKRSTEFQQRVQGLRSQGGQGIKKRNILAEETNRQFDMNVQNFANVQADTSFELIQAEINGLEREAILNDDITEKMRQALEVRFQHQDIIEKLVEAGAVISDQESDMILDLLEQKQLREDNLDLQNFLKENAKEQRRLADQEQKDYDDAIKKLNKLKENSNSVTKDLEKQNELNQIKLTGSEYDIALAEEKIGLTKEQLALFDEEAFKIAFNNKLKIDGLIEQKQLYDEIGASIEKSIVGNLTDAVMGTQTLGQAAVNVLNNLKRKIIEVQIEQAVSGIGKGIGGFLGNLFKRERGGPVSAGGAYLVGEKGPEILQMGSRGGNIIPNNKIEGGTTNMVTVNVDASGSSVAGNSTDAQALGAAIGAAVQAQLIKEKRPGGLLTR